MGDPIRIIGEGKVGLVHYWRPPASTLTAVGGQIQWNSDWFSVSTFMKFLQIPISFIFKWGWGNSPDVCQGPLGLAQLPILTPGTAHRPGSECQWQGSHRLLCRHRTGNAGGNELIWWASPAACSVICLMIFSCPGVTWADCTCLPQCHSCNKIMTRVPGSRMSIYHSEMVPRAMATPSHVSNNFNRCLFTNKTDYNNGFVKLKGPEPFIMKKCRSTKDFFANE